GLRPAGAQLLRFAARDAGTGFGVILETTTGGRFFFGDGSIAEKLSDRVTARYLFDHDDRPRAEWQEFVAPFFDLAWSRGACSGGPLPSHPVDSLTLYASGPIGAAVDFARLGFLRPRATTLSDKEGRTYCLVGRVPSFKKGQVVQIRARDEIAAP